MYRPLVVTLGCLAAAVAGSDSDSGTWDCNKMTDARPACRDPCFSLQCAGFVETVEGALIGGDNNAVDCIPEHRQKQKPLGKLQPPFQTPPEPSCWTSEAGTNYTSVSYDWCCCKRC